MVDYHRHSIRLRGFDYSQDGFYFVTICTHHNERILGDIVGRSMFLSKVGEITNKMWVEIPQHYPYCMTDTYQIMPNHIHGILVIDNRVGANNHSPKERANNNLPLQGTSGTLGAIIRGFKIGVTKWCRKHTEYFAVWQRNYYEHIIRNELEYLGIRQYIQANPKNWGKDELFK